MVRIGWLLLLVLAPCAQAGFPDERFEKGLNARTFEDGQRYYVYVPRKVLQRPKGARLLAAIHGYSGRTDDEPGRQRVLREIERWRALADKERWVLLAPQFAEHLFRDDYQRLTPAGPRADLRLLTLVDEVARQLPGLVTERIYLFGFSGGGQFVHRFAAFHASKVERAVAGAPGWWMWPEPDQAYPYGFSREGLPEGMVPDLRALCGLPLLVLVGDQDHDQAAFRASEGEDDPVHSQGPGRRDRAQNWAAAIRERAKENDWPCRIEIEVVRDTEHKISPALQRSAEQFLRGRGRR